MNDPFTTFLMDGHKEKLAASSQKLKIAHILASMTPSDVQALLNPESKTKEASVGALAKALWTPAKRLLQGGLSRLVPYVRGEGVLKALQAAKPAAAESWTAAARGVGPGKVLDPTRALLAARGKEFSRLRALPEHGGAWGATKALWKASPEVRGLAQGAGGIAAYEALTHPLRKKHPTPEEILAEGF